MKYWIDSEGHEYVSNGMDFLDVETCPFCGDAMIPWHVEDGRVYWTCDCEGYKEEVLR
jgi:hypothetical protein